MHFTPGISLYDLAEMGQDQSSEQEQMSDTDKMTTNETHFRILDLPSELIDQILASLDPVSLAKTCQTCKALSSRANAERLWRGLLKDCIPHNEHSSKPFTTWKELYSSFYPYWFLPQQKIWFSDKTNQSNPLVGQLMLIRYDYGIGSIEGYRLVAEHPEIDTFFRWSLNHNVLIHSFEPKVRIFLDDPIIKLDQGAFTPGQNRLQQEVLLSREGRRAAYGIRSKMFPAIPIPKHRQFASMSLWPPDTIPSPERVRNESPSLFDDPSHKPTSFEQMSTTTFRLRKWLIMGALSERIGLRTAEDVVTYSTILPEYYTPTKEKPFQGLWVGDYAGHGCEFLVIIQSTPEEAEELPPVEENPLRILTDQFLPPALLSAPPQSTPILDEIGYRGRLDAIKLTGDPNIPRGQVSWIAEDISPAGTLRIAQEPEFSGARVVKSAGHIASTGFREDRFTPAQLIMISEDRLAQYWVEMGHISYFNRINIDDYLRIPGPANGETSTSKNQD